MDEHKHEHGVEPITAALAGTCAAIAPSTYYAAKTRAPSPRSVTDTVTLVRIRAMAEVNYGVYGARKMWWALARTSATCSGSSGQGAAPVARCTVERLMRQDGICGVSKAKNPRTTFPAAVGDRPADKVNRNFTAEGPDRLWVADITYIRTFCGWVYAAFVMDMYSRRVVGWQVSTSLHTNLALDALQMGLWSRTRTGRQVSGLVHHSDRGVQYRAVRYTDRLEDADVVASVGSKGDSYDNAAAEALNSTFKSELIRNRHVLARQGAWRGIDDVEIAVAEWVQWYNTTRLHGSLDDVPPAEHEAAYYADHAPCEPVGATP